MILRVYKVGDQSWVSPGALLAALRDKDANPTFIRHHRDVDVGLAACRAIALLRTDFRGARTQAISGLLWSLVIVSFTLWSPIFYALAPTTRGAVWVCAGACGLVALRLFMRAVMGLRAARHLRIEDWVVRDGPTLLPPVTAWQEGE